MNPRPATLYHGSSLSGLVVLTPQRRSIRDIQEGPVVFASPDKAIASMFMVSVPQYSGRFDDVPYFVAVKNEFLTKDVGGSLYEVGAEEFDFNPVLGLGELEWTTGASVSVLGEERYTSVLDCMLGHGVQVYLVGPEVFSAIGKDSDHGLSILKAIKSENELQNKHVRPLPSS